MIVHDSKQYRREDLMKTVQRWLQWKNRYNEQPPAPPRITTLKLTFLVINSELYFVQDCANSNTRSIVFNTTFSIMWVMKGLEERLLSFNIKNLEVRLLPPS